MKKLFIPLLVLLILAPTEKAFSIAGIGLYYNSDPISVSGGTEGTLPIFLDRKGFNGARGGGIFIYIDAIPFVDLEASIETALNTYQFQFKNNVDALPPVDFGWARVSTYLTARKKLLGFGVPVLGGVKIYAGGGYNKHTSAPLASLDMVSTLLGDITADFDPDNLEEKLVEYIKENKIDKSGLHIQAGAQVKVLTFNAFINYRVTLAEDVVPDAKSFSSLWVGLAFGF